MGGGSIGIAMSKSAAIALSTYHIDPPKKDDIEGLDHVEQPLDQAVDR